MKKHIIDNVKAYKKENIQLKILIVEEGKEEGEWIEFPDYENKNYDKYNGKRYRIDKIWSNCALTLKDDVIYKNEKSLEINISSTLNYLNTQVKYLNSIATIEEVQAIAEDGKSWNSIEFIVSTILLGNYHFFPNITLEDLVCIYFNINDSIEFSGPNVDKTLIEFQQKYDNTVNQFRLNGYFERTTGVIHFFSLSKNRKI